MDDIRFFTIALCVVALLLVGAVMPAVERPAIPAPAPSGGLPLSDPDRAAVILGRDPAPMVAVIDALPLVDDFAEKHPEWYIANPADLEAWRSEDGAMKPAHQGWKRRQYTRKGLFLAPGECVSIEVHLPHGANLSLGLGPHRFTLSARGCLTMEDPVDQEWDLYGMAMTGYSRIFVGRPSGTPANALVWWVVGGGIEGNGAVTIPDLPAKLPISIAMLLSKHDGKDDTCIRNLRHGPLPGLPAPRVATPGFLPRLQKANDLPGDLPEAEALLVYESGAKNVTTAEVEALLAYAAAVPFGANNLDNDYTMGMSHGSAMVMDQMFEITRRRPFLDRLVQFAEIAMAGRNDPVTGAVIAPGKRHLVWPHYGKIRLAGTQRLVVTELSEGLPRLIPRCARRILEHPEVADFTNPAGVTYGQIARALVKESIRSLDDYALAYFLDPTTDRFRYPDHDPDPHLFLDGPHMAGRTIPWNRQWMLATGILDLALCLRRTGDDPQHLATFERIVRAAVAHFLATAETVEVQGQPCLLWYYVLPAPGLGKEHYEDQAHGSIDLAFLSEVYQAGGFGLTEEHMRTLANTIWLLMHKGDGMFAARIDGQGKTEPFLGSNLAPYAFYARWQPGIYDVLSRNVAGLRRKNGPAVAALLAHRHWLAHDPPDHGGRR